MGRKGSWFSAIKRVLVSSSKEKSTNLQGQEKKKTKEKKGLGILRAGESKSFIQFFREPSSIEKILSEVDEEFFSRLPVSSESQKPTTLLPYRPTSPRVVSPRAASPPQASSSMPSLPGVASPRVSPPRTTYQKVSPLKDSSPRIMHNHKEVSYRPEPTPRDLQISATKIQTAYRGYRARRSFRALRGLGRLHRVVRGHSVKRQTVNTMKQMQLLVRVQIQIHSRRTKMLEDQASQRQAYKNEREIESRTSKYTNNQLGDGTNEEWDASGLNKETREERLRKRVEAVIKRERAMSYAYSHQLWKPQPKSTKSALGGFLWWWNWFEGHRPPSTASERQTPMKNMHLTPPGLISPSPSLQTRSYKSHNYTQDNHEQLTPRSTKSSMSIKGKHFLQTPSTTPPSNSSGLRKYPGPRARAPNSRFDVAMRDDDSLRSCPPFSVPNYMQPTVSTKAKVRENSNPKESVPGTPGNDSRKRFSFPFTPNIGSFKWNRGSSRDSSSQRAMEKHRSSLSTDDHMSMGSAVSMPAVVGRKRFNRFV